jgi:hypothetical protein
VPASLGRGTLKEVKTLGSEKGKWLGYGLYYEQRREVEPGLYSV